jgi:GMP reductase
MIINNDLSLDFDDVLIEPQRSTLETRDFELSRTFQFYHSPRVWTGVPVMCANMGFCSFELATSLAKNKIIACLHKYHSVEELFSYFNLFPQNKDYTWVSVGYKQGDLDKLLELRNKLVTFNMDDPNICIDVPNGHMDSFVSYCKKVRDKFPKSIIMAGNVTNTSSTQELILYGGVDIVKCGVGGGSACSTRFMTGCGVPQLTCVLNNAYVAHGLQNEPKRLGLICSDGGHKNPGDVNKAICAGSDFVMLGGYFAGCDECIGEWAYGKAKTINGKCFRPKTQFSYYGMSTHHSQKLYEEKIKSYRASEGTRITVPYKGPVNNVIRELLGGIRSCCCYIGATNIKDMNKCAKFQRVTKIHNNSNPILGV